MRPEVGTILRVKTVVTWVTARIVSYVFDVSGIVRFLTLA
jgi:hypothetical protein